MPATKTFPKDVAGSPYELGLVLQSKSKVRFNEFGLAECTLVFATYNHNFKNFRSPRGAWLRSLKLGDDSTRATLRQLDFLGVQLSDWTRNGLSPGKGLFTITAQGAIFDGDSSAFNAIAPNGEKGNDPITAPWNPSTQSGQTVSFHTYKPSTIQTNPQAFVPVLDVTLDYYSVDLYFEYMARDKAAAPRFLEPTYDVNDVGLIVATAFTNQLYQIAVSRASAWQTNLNVLSTGQIQIIPGQVGIPQAIDQSIWGPWVKYTGTNVQFKQTQAGPYWHVLEQNSIRIEPLIPGNVTGS